MVLLLGLGVAGLIGRAPWLFTVLLIASTGYLLYLAFRIATSNRIGEADARAKPLTFLDAAAFQWVNPKAWAMTLGAATSFSRPAHMAADVGTVALILALFGLPCIMLWAGGGVAIRRYLHRPALLRTFNLGMAGLLVASLAPGIVEALG
jgi:threonine/homoserine/homoserine lactone efflux protein